MTTIDAPLASARRAFAAYPSLKGKCAFVTGGATGIGAAMVQAYADQGVTVGFIDIAEQQGQQLCQQITETGGTAWFRRVDVTDIAALQTAIAEFSDAVGPVDILVNNVANDTRHAMQDLTPEGWNQSFDVNLRPAFFAIQAVAETMIARKQGSIVNFGSISWKAKVDSMPAYTTAKAALHGLTRSFVKPLGAAGVRINTVLPGWVMTDRQIALHLDAEGEVFLQANQPLAGRITPEDAAAMALFLSADDSAMCTGQEFSVDGGWI